MGGDNPPFVVGAGPVGLAGALFLSRSGRAVRVVEQSTKRSQQSRALAVNPRTLTLLEPTGVAERMLEIGEPIRGVHLHRGAERVAEIEFADLHPRYPFMLALSQATTEHLLEDALEREGVRVERGVRMTACAPADKNIEVTLDHGAGGATIAVCPWLLAADGAHSVARHSLGIDFPGAAFAEDWHLADVPLRCEHAADRAHVFFLEGGEFQFMLRVVDDGHRAESGAMWRVLGNRPAPLDRLVGAEAVGTPTWESSFRVAHRLASTLAMGGVYLAGDSAHIHSPVGARGMNLGIEDAWVFAALEGAGRLREYERLRRPIDAGVVRRVELVSKLASGENAFFRAARRAMPTIASHVGFLRRRVLKTVAGLDHPLPRV